MIAIIMVIFSAIYYFIATNPPTSVVSMRSSFSQAILSWSPPASNDPIVDGYEVFYDSPDGIRLSDDVGNTNMIILDSLDPELFYTAFVVAYGGDLPSTASSLVNITEGSMYKYYWRVSIGSRSNLYHKHFLFIKQLFCKSKMRA